MKTAKTQKLRVGDMVVTRDECQAMIHAALTAYDRSATRRFGWWSLTLRPLVAFGALLRHGLETAIGFGTYIGRRVRGQTHEEAIG
jgi:hypothetical protein